MTPTTLDPGIARATLRHGGTLVRDTGGAWFVLRDAMLLGTLDADAARRLTTDRALGLRPAGDHLPGFPADCSQTWRSPIKRRPRRAT